jgi:hypothetical protein
VLDASQSAVPNAQITITNQATGISSTITSDVRGNYVAPSLSPGSYTVKIEAPGFRSAISADNPVSIAQTTRVDIALQVGQVTETVNVRAEAPLVQSTSSDIGETVSMRQVQTLPLNGRIFSQLVHLVPGAVPRGFGAATESPSGAGARSPIMSSVNGTPWSGTSFTLDGVYNQEPLNAFINVAPPVESIEEFRVQTNNPSAEYGQFGGAVVNATLRSGSNELHGSLFEYLRNEALNARSFFSATKAPFKTNQFGGTIGGPIVRNKAFFFGDYQGIRLRQGATRLYSVPTANMRQGIFLPEEGFTNAIYDPDSASSTQSVTQFAGNRIPAARFDPVSAKVLPLWPTPNQPGAVNNYIENVSDAQNVNTLNIKGDYQFEKAGRLFLRESYTRSNLDAQPAGNQFLSTDPDAKSRNHNAVIGYSVSIRPTILNELRLGFSRFDTFHFGNDFGIDKNNELGILNGNLPQFPESSGIANFAIAPLVGFGAPGWTNAQRLSNTYQITNGTTVIAGPHTLKFRRRSAAYPGNTDEPGGFGARAIHVHPRHDEPERGRRL